MRRREMCKSLGLLSCITEQKVLLQETGTLGQVPTVGCQPSGFRMYCKIKWTNRDCIIGD